MSWLSKGFKKLRKKVSLKNLARVGLAAATGGTSEAVIRAAKPLAALGSVLAANKKAASLKIHPVSVRAVIARQATMAPVNRIEPTAFGKAQTMPGGAPIGRARTGGVRRRAKVAGSRRKASRSPAKAKTAVRKGRRPPAGGKDFKALSASWNAAGKPGTWLQWVKTH